jgi:hypothetical protein
MAFFDRSKIYPTPYNKIKLQEFDNKNTKTLQQGRDGSGAYASTRGAILCFLCDYYFKDTEEKSNRLVCFKGFVEDLKIDLSIEYDDIELFRIPVTPKQVSDYGLSYNLTFNVVAHSVNDAMSNMARFSELDRILHYPIVDSPLNTGSPTPADASPESFIFLSNLIGNGLLASENGYTDINITNHFVRKYGLKTPVSDLTMDPDLEMGFFEFDDKFYFKSFKISLKLPITNMPFHISRAWNTRFNRSSNQNNIQRWKTIIPFVKKNIPATESNRSYTYYGFKSEAAKVGYNTNVWDSRGFPFCVPFDDNIIKQDYGSHLGYYPKNKRAKIGFCINSNKISRKNNPYIRMNYLNFNAFLESYSFNRKQKTEVTQPSGDLIAQKHTFGGNSIVFFNLSFNAVAGSVNEAKANAMKLAILYRMAALGKKGETPTGQIKVLFANLIKDAKKQNSNGNYDFNDIYDNGMDSFIASLSVEIDQEMGYFEESSYFIPKAYKITMELVLNNGSTGLIYLEDEDFGTMLKNRRNDSTYWPFGVGYEIE